VLHRTRLAVQASFEPRPDVALSQIQAAAAIELPESDLFNDVYIATLHTHLLLMTNAAPEEVAAAARPVLRAAAGEEHETWPLSALRTNVAMAFRRAGRVGHAAELLDPRTEEPVSFLTWAEHSERVVLDALRGRHEAAARRIEELSAVPFDTGLGNLVETTEVFAEADLWGGRAQAAYDRAVDLVHTCAPTDASGWLAGLLVLAARAAADLAPSGPPTAREQLLGTVLGLRDEAVDDPFEPLPADRVRSALASSWTAETLRLSGRAEVETWVAAARRWDRLTRPHEAAYCRWRAAEVALRTGQGSAARSLLQRARHDAREHVPLLALIAATA